MLKRPFLLSLISIVFLSCKTKQVTENEEYNDKTTTGFVFVEPLPNNPQYQQNIMQLNSNHVLTLDNTEMAMALILDQSEHQREENVFLVQFKASIDGSIMRFNSDNVRQERDARNRLMFVGEDDKYRMFIIHYADSLKEDDQSVQQVGDMAMRQDASDSLSYFDVKLVKNNTTDTTHLGFWGNFYYDHRLHGHWVLTEVNGFDELTLDIFDSQLPNMTIRLDDMHVEGFAGCNRFFGPFNQIGFKIDMSAYAMTKMFCQDKPDIIAHLQKSIQYRLEGNRLIFDYPMGNEIIFEKRSN